MCQFNWNWKLGLLYSSHWMAFLVISSISLSLPITIITNLYAYMDISIHGFIIPYIFGACHNNLFPLIRGLLILSIFFLRTIKNILWQKVKFTRGSNLQLTNATLLIIHFHTILQSQIQQHFSCLLQQQISECSLYVQIQYYGSWA